MVQTLRSLNHKYKGKICHFGRKEFNYNCLAEYYWIPIKGIDDRILIELRDKIYKLLLSEGFVFFSETPEFQVKTKFGNLLDFGIQFHHIL
jgi:hypothetical protein